MRGVGQRGPGGLTHGASNALPADILLFLPKKLINHAAPPHRAIAGGRPFASPGSDSSEMSPSPLGRRNAGAGEVLPTGVCVTDFLGCLVGFLEVNGIVRMEWNGIDRIHRINSVCIIYYSNRILICRVMIKKPLIQTVNHMYLLCHLHTWDP